MGPGQLQRLEGRVSDKCAKMRGKLRPAELAGRQAVRTRRNKPDRAAPPAVPRQRRLRPARTEVQGDDGPGWGGSHR